jgi:hypothetical protein
MARRRNPPSDSLVSFNLADIAPGRDIVAELVARLGPVKLLSIIPLSEAESCSSLDEDTIRRLFPELIIQISARRSGMRLIHALLLAPRAKVEPAMGLGHPEVQARMAARRKAAKEAWQQTEPAE